MAESTVLAAVAEDEGGGVALVKSPKERAGCAARVDERDRDSRLHCDFLNHKGQSGVGIGLYFMGGSGYNHSAIGA